ncbi:alpha-1,2-fucosyltransferase [Olivibacter sp. CPCC 100613]|uniref:alpha-1,2-fucosyltransferase n=1 Tax=Olivibacter sp. CPCC 100613 TaxID=3079931 RepID=UPI002FF555FF
MKIVRFLGGLGNQMFQYAFYKALEKQFDTVKADIREFKTYKLHNGFELENVFDIRLRRASALEVNLLDHRNRQWKYRKLRRLLLLKGEYYEEQTLFSYNASLFDDSSSKIYWGYWQNHLYVERVADQLRKDFTFSDLKPSKNFDLLNELEQSEQSVAIHIRRGDYLKDPYLGGLVNLDYFEKAISLIRGQVEKPIFYIFSDDILWCKENLPLNDNEANFIDWNKGAESYLDMQLMSNCKHAIISNSSFSWWAAWLNTNPDRLIVVPKVWYRLPEKSDFRQMHPSSWVLL